MTPLARRAHRVHLGCVLFWVFATCGASANSNAAGGVRPDTMHHYLLLENAQQQYQQLARQPGLTALPPLPSRTLRSGEAYQGMAALRTLLAATGDLQPPATLPDPVEAFTATPSVPATLDEETIGALKHFQERHGLEQDGMIGPATWRALVTPMSARLRQIELTLARWRSQPANPHQRALFINIPRFRLYAISDGSDAEAQMLQMDVVVGRTLEKLRTPVFTADLTHLVFAPYWDVPRSITLDEVIPAVRRDPAYLARHHFELVDGAGAVVPASLQGIGALERGTLRVRQRPGDDNALGAVKFMLPNANNVYLHDTPARALFARPVRAFSHGCIRVADPAALARWLLADAVTWDASQIDAAMLRTEPLQVDLAAPVRVYIVYGTAIAREDGSVLFLDDLYGLDHR
jgi:L,D-transpeptidase YcbB